MSDQGELEERVAVLESVVFYLKMAFETLGLCYNSMAEVVGKAIEEGGNDKTEDNQ